MQQSLEALGWSQFFADAFEPYEAEGLIPARVAVQERGAYLVLTAEGPLAAEATGQLYKEGAPVAGDWVAVERLPDEPKGIVRALLPRRTKFARKEAWLRTDEQVVGANVDIVFLVAGLDGDFNPRRLERYLTAAWNSGADPVVVLTKSDLADDVPAAVTIAEATAIGVPVHALSNVTGAGLESLDHYLEPGRTIALLGSSGVGKSTLANRLLGTEQLATADVRADGRGRHTTTHRELVQLPGGCFLLDTPGMRQLQLWAEEGSAEGVFSDVTELAAQCRFADCSHESEPGCAVQIALANGALDPERYASYCKLVRELRALAVRQDARLQSEERKKRRRAARGRRKTEW
ncbi:MAG: ribosome small subunit-dependent GTPase A [Gaiellaceae bacterium]